MRYTTNKPAVERAKHKQALDSAFSSSLPALLACTTFYQLLINTLVMRSFWFHIFIYGGRLVEVSGAYLDPYAHSGYHWVGARNTNATSMTLARPSTTFPTMSHSLPDSGARNFSADGRPIEMTKREWESGMNVKVRNWLTAERKNYAGDNFLLHLTRTYTKLGPTAECNYIDSDCGVSRSSSTKCTCCRH